VNPTNYSFLVQHFLENSSKRLPDKEFIVCGDDRFTYAEINEKADLMATSLIELGVKRQDRVAIFLDNSTESVIALFGILKAGAIFIMLSSGMKVKKLNYILNNSEARVLISHPNKKRIVKAAIVSAPALEHIIWCADNQNTQSFQTSNLNPQTVQNHLWSTLLSNHHAPG
jgi:acyl-CoA synthetase (AMP-forming)/AMP-acid ligase II